MSDRPSAQRKSEPEFRNLPPPRRSSRTATLALMAVTALLSAALAWGLRAEVMFALTEREAVELGDYASAKLGSELEGRLVRARVHTDAPALSFRRPFDAASHRVAAAAAAEGDRRWVVYAVPASADGPRFVPPSLVTGRLVRVEDAGPRYRGLGGALSAHGGASGWVLLDGDSPTDLSWIIGLEALLLAFVAFSLGGIFAVLRRVGPRVS